MTREISLTEDEMNELDKKLQAEKDKLPADEAQMLVTLLNKAKAERGNVKAGGPGWLFSWTYRF